jgi:HlyD family secretion protein
MTRKRSRTWIMIGIGVLLIAVIAYAFWPRAMPVDTGDVRRSDMIVTIDDEARTRVRDAYVVSAPIAGRLLRVEVKPGDAVKGGQTVIARMLPSNPPALNVRTREQIRAAVQAAEAALEAARANLNKVIAEKDYAEADLQRKRELKGRGVTSQAAFDEAERAFRSATANLDIAKANIAVREAELAKARAQLISFESDKPSPRFERPSQLGAAELAKSIPLTAPISGRILRVIQESETVIAAGAPILEIGNISNDLEVVVELLSTDAVQVSEGNRVLIRKWGGVNILNGVVERVEPWGFTKVSALGVEEQRVKSVVRFTDAAAKRRNLGHGFRVETRIVIWEAKDALVVPSSALFRQGGEWAVFVVDGGRAKLTKLQIGRNNGTLAEVKGGVTAGATVILYPGPSLIEGQKVERRKVSG